MILSFCTDSGTSSDISDCECSLGLKNNIENESLLKGAHKSFLVYVKVPRRQVYTHVVCDMPMFWWMAIDYSLLC